MSDAPERQYMKRILSLVLLAAFLCCIPGCKRAATVPESIRHTELSFSGLVGSGIDAALEIARANELLFRIERRELSGKHAQETLEARMHALKILETDAAIAYVRYCTDVTNDANRQKYDTLSIQTETLACILTDAALRLSEDPSLQDVYDAETVEALLYKDALSDEAILLLLERERALVGAYEALSDQLRVEHDGRMWTGDGILSDPSLSEDDFDTLYEAYLDLFHAKAGEIFLELNGIRREIAETLGYDSYADYRYACFGRTYSPEDAALLSERVRTEAVPLFAKMRDDFYRAAGRLYGAVFGQEQTMERIGAAIADTAPTLSEPWNYMRGHGLYDLSADFRRMPGSFTTYFAAYGAPFLFGEWSGGFESIPAVAHEFGHFASFYLNGDTAGGENSPDLAEIDAQGLELLTVLRYDTLYGDLCEDAETAELFYVLYTLIDGCMEDAFLQFAYGPEERDLAALDAEYDRLCRVYGLDALGAEGRSWTQIAHTFQAPFYDVSYTTGMTAALELYLWGKKDPAAAKDAYLKVLTRGRGAGYIETLTAAGLHDPFAADTIGEIARGLENVRRIRQEEWGRDSTHEETWVLFACAFDDLSVYADRCRRRRLYRFVCDPGRTAGKPADGCGRDDASDAEPGSEAYADNVECRGRPQALSRMVLASGRRGDRAVQRKRRDAEHRCLCFS